jgi:hypothetical protein
MAMNNTIGAIAASGGATVFANTLGGNATTGNAQSLATLMNMLQSSASGFMPGDNAVTFVSNINGDVNGDLLLDPALIGTIQPTSGPSDGTLSINALNNTSQSIANDINLDATTGNARVDANTRAGNATSGNATAIANVVNILNSAITSGKSFLGVVNINGNLNGDILLPPHFIDQLIASNVPTVTINTSLDLNNNVSQSIANHVNADATSGNATVGMNTTAGSATTGTAKTNITAFNLTHSGVVGTNSLLVFVNVLGTWYGMIFDAPPGTTTAQLGSGITSYDSNTDVAAQNNVNQSILNNINVNAHSGDADVARNTTAGNATSGNAYAAVNVLNVADSNMSLANWFGILFINVFGSWNGSFGIDTAAGDPPVTAPAATDDPVTAVSQIPKTFATFHYTPTSANHNTSSSAGSSSTSNNASASLSQGGAVLAASHTQSGSNLTTPSASTNVKSANFLLPALGISLGVLMLLAERFRSLRRANT